MEQGHKTFRGRSRIRLLGQPFLAIGLLLCTDDGFRTVQGQEDPFAALIRPTEPLSPEQERERFQLPPGFVIELVAAEPDILKPLNLAFDARGRLWVTTTQEYPFPAPPDRPGRDALKILQDTDGNGTFDKVITFADDLNIPIGVYPYRQGAIVFSIPHIWYLEDTDKDDRADRRIRLYGPMGYERDTHGMNNAFRRGLDGWLYACHGFNNETRVAGNDGHEVLMHSGNTYRMQVDGRRIEQYTWGQVNPFGMTMDRWFYLYTADCHSKPIYQLIRGGYYPSFGKPDDGLGFVPPVMDHAHGSTAIAGVVCYEATQFPEEYRGNFFSGNVMTSRVNRNAVVWQGTTPKLVEQPDFVTTQDPWFRPVDLCLGPDGSIYIADFYNRIIGHYEVPLDHPGRDRTRGRIWRIRYLGPSQQGTSKTVSLVQADITQLLEALADPNLTVRLLATDQLSDRIGVESVPWIRRAVHESDSPYVRAHGLWGLFRLSAVDAPLLCRLLDDASPLVRAHAARVAAEFLGWDPTLAEKIKGALRDPEAHVRRAAAGALGVHTEIDASEVLIDTLLRTDPSDVLLVHTLRIALRNQCRDPARLEKLWPLANNPLARRQMASVAIALPHAQAARWLLETFQPDAIEQTQAVRWAYHVARYLETRELPQLIDWIRHRFQDQLGVQFELLQTVLASLRERNADPRTIRSWAVDLVRAVLAQAPPDPWMHLPVKPGQITNPWTIQRRQSADGRLDPFLSTLPSGEATTGRLRSASFEIPEQFEFYIAGHGGFPHLPAQRKNRVILVDATSGRVLREQLAPRNDLAQRVNWQLGSLKGQRAYLELIDEDDQHAYAWLAVGRFQPPVVRVPEQSPAEWSRWATAACQLIGHLSLNELAAELERLSEPGPYDVVVQAAALEARSRLTGRPEWEWLSVVVQQPDLPETLRQSIGGLLKESQAALYREWLEKSMRSGAAALQKQLAEKLVTNRAGAELLLDWIERGVASARLLLQPQLRQRLEQALPPSAAVRIARLVEQMPPAKQQIEALIEQRRHVVLAGTPEVERGAEVFRRACAACHQLNGQGAIVGPQLDGIGQRGLARILEDLLDPHRNVDIAFRTETLQLDDGRILVALPRGQRGALRVYADQEGKELAIPANAIEQRRPSNLSLMPDNVAADLPEKDFIDLVGYLLTQRTPSNGVLTTDRSSNGQPITQGAAR